MYGPDWDAISARVAGLLAAARIYFPGVDSVTADYHAVNTTALLPLACAIFHDLKEFRQRHGDSMPPAALAALDEFITTHGHLFLKAQGIAGVHGVSVALACIRSTLDFHLQDRDARARALTDRAFAHLQRSIVVDASLREKWSEAFSQGEVACESLGACHLLLHGIWAFKVSAAGERTDLVFQEPLERGEAFRIAPVAVVLTEWKVAGGDADLGARFLEARRQAELYAVGSLFDLELASVRYLVVVTRGRLTPPEDVIAGGSLYRHVVISVAPRTPSVTARGL